MFKLLTILLFWPILQMQQQQQPTQLPPSAYKELSTRWDIAGTFDCGLDKTLAVMGCPSEAPEAGQLIVVDSTGSIVEMRYDESGWTRVRQFSVGEPVTAACTGAPHLDRVWRVYVGTQSGTIFEFSRSTVGWVKETVREVTSPVTFLHASDPGEMSISQLAVIDGDGIALNLWVSESDEWITRVVPEVEGGASDITFDYHRQGLRMAVAGSQGIIYRFQQDSTGNWNGEEWASMPAGPLDMAASADPTLKDIAVFYSGSDGIFRYLFHDYRLDEKARVPIAGGTTHIIGKGPQRRFNEFFAMAADEFCLFEFNYSSRQWDKIPMKTIPTPVASTTLCFGRGGPLAQIYVACVDGTIHEFTREAFAIDEE